MVSVEVTYQFKMRNYLPPLQFHGYVSPHNKEKKVLRESQHFQHQSP